MPTRKALCSALLAAGIIGTASLPLPSVAATSVDIQLNFGPPPVRYEAVPAPRAGYVWSPGHWQWSRSAGRHVWVTGHWERARVGYVYRAPRWVERGGRWYYETPRWDRDGDGIPNRRDPTPDTSRPGDRDGDGVPNRRDARPDNPYRY